MPTVDDLILAILQNQQNHHMSYVRLFETLLLDHGIEETEIDIPSSAKRLKAQGYDVELSFQMEVSYKPKTE